MSVSFSRRAALAALAASVAAPAFAGAPASSLFPRARGERPAPPALPEGGALVERARIPGATGFAVADAATGEMLESHAETTALPPASVAKALTAGYALEFLGRDHRFETRLLTTGTLSEGVLTGDLILAGGGDPTLDTDAVAELARRLKAAGVSQVTGALHVWGGALPRLKTIDPEQPDHVGYSPAVSGLNLNYNRVHFEWRRSGSEYTTSLEARSETLRPAVRMARMRIEDRSLPVYTYADRAGRDDWTVARGQLGKGGARWLPVRKPELYAGEVFQSLAGAQGIKMGAPEVIETLPEGAEELAKIESRPLAKIVNEMLLYSTNLTAEVLGLSATVKRSISCETLADSAQALNLWANSVLGTRAVALADHSGLGDDSRVSAADMVRALIAMRERVDLAPLLKRIKTGEPPKGVPSVPVTVRAKTGTLNFVSGLGGFETLPDGRVLAFAIFSGDLDRRAGIPRAQRERPDGARGWASRARSLQKDLLALWGARYSA
ncbi:D-alanyl-D-alanine carboxypeptidase/D-alanyl-D-alanine endopeptidase [Litorisediminicola beolgyonensis]|uniref:D-alanyl-D-alanine carboxypeptidase/D-alanyl-D-alanine-endopeptidase n=1 Tax=Litorisediminicola beolgyonensis TaxID=1173614 RepID=A0ABW3ZMB4_9RHOB